MELKRLVKCMKPMTMNYLSKSINNAITRKFTGGCRMHAITEHAMCPLSLMPQLAPHAGKEQGMGRIKRPITVEKFA